MNSASPNVGQPSLALHWAEARTATPRSGSRVTVAKAGNPAFANGAGSGCGCHVSPPSVVPYTAPSGLRVSNQPSSVLRKTGRPRSAGRSGRGIQLTPPSTVAKGPDGIPPVDAQSCKGSGTPTA